MTPSSSRSGAVSFMSSQASALRAASQAARQRRREEVRAQQEVMAARTVANPEKKKHMRAALAEEGIITYLYQHQDKAAQLEALLPPEKWVTPWGRRVYSLLLGKTKQGEATLSALAEELTPDELSELTRALAQRREVPPSWEDVEGYCHRGRFAALPARIEKPEVNGKFQLDARKEWYSIWRHNPIRKP